MPSCAAYGCTQRTKTADVSLHRFPKDTDLRQKWISAVRRKNFAPSDKAVLCSRHFQDEDIDRTSVSTVRIRTGAVPCLFAFPKYLSKVKKVRKPPMERSLLCVVSCEKTTSTACVNINSITPSNSERSGELRQSLISALIRVCRQKLKFVESVHIAGCLSFSIDNVEKLNVVISEVVMVCPASVPVPPLSFPKPETPSNLEQDGQIQGRSDAREDDDLQLNTRGQNDVLKSLDEDKNELKELVRATEIFQIMPVVGMIVPSSGPIVNIKPVHLVINNFSSPSELLAKETDNTVAKSNDRYRLHRHIVVRSQTCVTCDAAFVSAAELRSHVTQVHPQIFKCPQCPEKFSVYDDVMEHMKVVHGVDGDTVPCEWCNRRFITSELLQEHVLLRHKKVCTTCKETFTDQRKLVLHRRTDHPNIPRHGGVLPHQCTLCNKSYPRSSNLKSHVRIVHDKLKPFLCSTCGKTFPYEQSLRLHLMLHNDERPFPCSFCRKSFVSRTSLRAHEELHSTSAAYVCDMCRRSFKTAKLLYTHRRRHVSDGERFMCDVCGQRFINLSRLESHRIVHSDVRNVQ